MISAPGSGPLEATADGEWVELRFPSLRPEPLGDAAPGDAALGAGALGAGPLDAAVRSLLAVPVTEVLRNDLGLMAVLRSAAEVRDARPDLAALQRLPVRSLIITAAGADEQADFVSRFFSPATGIAEDAVTGSAHCALGPYWIERLGRQPRTGRGGPRRSGDTDHPGSGTGDGQDTGKLK